MNEAIELRKKVDNAIGCGEYLLPLLDQIGEYDHSKWMSICSTGSVVSFDGEYFSSAKIEFNMRQNASMEFLENLKQRFDYLTDRYERAIHMEKHNKVLISGLTLSAAWWLSFAYKNDVPVNLAAYQKCIDELNAVSPYNKSFS